MRGIPSVLLAPVKGSLLVALACVLLPPALYADTTNLLTNPGAESGSLSGWIDGSGSAFTAFIPTDTPGGFFLLYPKPHTGNWEFSDDGGVERGGMELVQSVSVFTQGITAAMVNTGTLSAQFSFWENGLVLPDGSSFAPGNSGSGQVTIFLEGAGGQFTSAVSTASSQNGVWTEGGGTVPIPVGTTNIVYDLQTRDTVPDISNPYGDDEVFIDDNSLKILTPAGEGSGTGGSGAVSAPEIDPGSTTTALTLLLCGVAILGGQRQRVGRGAAPAQ